MLDKHPNSPLFKINEKLKQTIKLLLKQRNDFAKEVLELRWENAKLKVELDYKEESNEL